MLSRSAWITFLVFNVLAILIKVLSTNSSGNVSKDYSYINDDYPMRLPVPLGKAEITFDCSTRFELNNSMSSEVWNKATDTRSGGFVRLGPDYRVFAVSMYHQLHCMSSFQRALTQNPGKPSSLDHHIQHCLNYLRQFVLCSADDRIEPVVKVSTLRNQGCAPTFSRECRNWGELYSYSERNYLDFHEYKVHNGTWTCSNAIGQDAVRGTTHKSSVVNTTAICKY